jgi:hypothetical protein
MKYRKEYNNMKKIKMIKTLKKITRILMVLLIMSILFTKIDYAAFAIDKADLYAKGSYANMIKYNGIEVLTTFVVYAKDNIEYPAYCLDKDMPGVGEQGGYSVQINSLLTNVMIWRTIINGYPYKTPAQLGCNTKEEAFTATKQAVYCTLYNRNAEDYEPIGEQGQRVIQAMKQILNAARNSSQVKPSNNISINSTEQKWVVDQIDNTYLSQTFDILASVQSENCLIELRGDYPEGTMITDLSNKKISTISSANKFKILIPIKNIKVEGKFDIVINAKLDTKPVFYGKAPNSSLQDYAITGEIYEDASGSKTLTYPENLTKIIIKKVKEENHEPMGEVHFQLMDSNKNIIYTDLITDENGMIELNNMLPGDYYLEEIKTQEGYTRYEKLIQIKLDLNEIFTVTVTNSLKQETEYTSKTEEVNVNQKEEKITVNQDEKQTNINQEEKQITINEKQQEVDVTSQNESTNMSQSNVVIKLPKTGM